MPCCHMWTCLKGAYSLSWRNTALTHRCPTQPYGHLRDMVLLPILSLTCQHMTGLVIPPPPPSMSRTNFYSLVTRALPDRHEPMTSWWYTNSCALFMLDAHYTSESFYTNCAKINKNTLWFELKYTSLSNTSDTPPESLAACSFRNAGLQVCVMFMFGWLQSLCGLTT